jgi:hypothetical protein
MSFTAKFKLSWDRACDALHLYWNRTPSFRLRWRAGGSGVVVAQAGIDQLFGGLPHSLGHLHNEKIYHKKTRVARFLLAHHTKTGKIYQMTTKCTK